MLFLAKQPQLAKYVALLCSGAVLLGSLVMLAGYDLSTTDYQFWQDTEWFPAFGVSFTVGLDSLAMFFGGTLFLGCNRTRAVLLRPAIAAGNRCVGCFFGVGFLPVLYILGNCFNPNVLPDRHLGR